jgi:hypothetical protein
MIDVFISHPTPYTKCQKQFLALIEAKLAEHDVNPVNLGKNNWSFKSPLEPIKKIMSTCKAAVIVGLERHHSYIGYEREDSTVEKEHIHRFTSSAWIQIEAGMAYQAGLPLLILKEKKLDAEGILDSNSSDYFVFDVIIEKEVKRPSTELDQFIQSWVKVFK